MEKARLPGVEQLLLEYVKIADLIRHRIVVPISGEVFGFYTHNRFFLADREKQEILRPFNSEVQRADFWR